MPDQLRRVDLTLVTVRPEVVTRPDGDQHVEMAGFGLDSEPGAPRLPTLVSQVELPEGATVLGLDIVDDKPGPVAGHFRIGAAGATVHDEPGDEAQRERAREVAEQVAAANQRRIYGKDSWYPVAPAVMEGACPTRGSVIVPVRITPVQYNPVRGDLQWRPRVRVVIRYSLSERPAEAFGDAVVATAAQGRINPFAPATPDEPTPSSVDVAHNYVIIVPDQAIEQAMSRFVAWKESIGHQVIVVQLPDIVSNFSGVDDAERIREFLIRRHRQWGVHYVLLVGTMSTIPTRLLYMNDATHAYASDFYFANLVTTNWDTDNDDRWGEFSDDNYSHAYDVVVGRLPLDSATDVQRYCDNVVAFEQDTGQWKQSALFAAGFMDHHPTDGAELCERLKENVLTPAGWTALTLYERGGTWQSTYPSDVALDQTNYANECVAGQYGLVTLVAHGTWDHMEGARCSDPNRNCTGSNVSREPFGESTDIPTNCPSSVVNMIGCSTACPVPEYQHVETQPGGPLISPQRSRFPFVAQHEHNGVRYLRHGAVAAVGASAGTDYVPGWRNPGDGKSWSAAYDVHEELITQNKPVGDAFFEGMFNHASRQPPLLRGVRDLYLMGDPSLITEGIAPANLEHDDVLVHGGRCNHHAAAYDQSGDLYTVVSIGASAEPAELLIYSSSDHGKTWGLWYHLEGLPALISLDAVLNHAGDEESPYDDLLVFAASPDGTMRLYTFPLSGGTHSVAKLPIVGESYGASVGHDHLQRNSRVYLAYSYYDAHGGAHSVVAVSYDNGRHWQHWKSFSGYYMPSVDAGPNDNVYVSAIKINPTFDVCVIRSRDGGRSWASWTNLTQGDGANSHYDVGLPVVVASTDPGTPAVWVGYERQYLGLNGTSRTELGVAYSRDGAVTWERDLTLATGPGETTWLQMAGYKAGPNPWVNSVYVSSQRTASGWTNAKIMRRAISGGEPQSWRPAVIFNHVGATNQRPQLVYSPGAAGTGGGVVYEGTGGVYFSAPWVWT